MKDLVMNKEIESLIHNKIKKEWFNLNLNYGSKEYYLNINQILIGLYFDINKHSLYFNDIKLYFDESIHIRSRLIVEKMFEIIKLRQNG
jgi:hypothetical protein